jgi:hypothetical protein
MIRILSPPEASGLSKGEGDEIVNNYTKKGIRT